MDLVSPAGTLKLSEKTVHQPVELSSAATETMTDRTLAFLPEGLEVTATYADGSTRVVDNAKLHFSAIPAKAGTQTVTITADEVTATVELSSAPMIPAEFSQRQPQIRQL